MFIQDKNEKVGNKTDLSNKNKLHKIDKLGSTIVGNQTSYKVFVPKAKHVELHIFSNPSDTLAKVYNLNKSDNGFWETIINENHTGLYYCYNIFHEDDSKPYLVVDPYAKAVTTCIDYFNPRKSIVLDKSDFKWEDDSWIKLNHSDLIIYEMHVKDMTAHESSNSQNAGSYKGLLDNNKNTGLNYIKQLGVNAVEILPIQEFGYMEAPFKKLTNGILNTWNPYDVNHWGYMTSNYFAPSAIYNQSKNVKEEWIGEDASQIDNFKSVVKSFHKEKIAVIIDVVYNHLSEYEIGNLKQIDRDYYFRINDDGSFRSDSYCGNDLKTESPMVRMLILDSLKYWMTEFHIDGFRFDLGKLIDWQTVEEIKTELTKINPDVIIICEPWGGGYDPTGFSNRGWTSWNDQIRNGLKGENPFNGKGWIFHNFYGHNNSETIKSYTKGTLLNDGGLFNISEHSVNYLESHDGYTLGDFIRIASGEYNVDKKVIDADSHVRLSENQLKLNKLAAAFLFTSRGLTMIHSGQEFARTKVIQKVNGVEEHHSGKLDHNSYNKDNETNYINYNHAEINNELLSYYKELIKFRKHYKAFTRTSPENIEFLNSSNDFQFAYIITYRKQKFIVAFNASEDGYKLNLPEGNWEVLINDNHAKIKSGEFTKDKTELTAKTCKVLKLKN